MSLPFTLLACVGLTFILKYASILSWPRSFLCRIKFLKSLFDCSLCLGFWAGCFLAIVNYFIKWDDIFFLLPLSSAAFCWIIDSLLRVVQTLEIALDKHIDKP